MKERILYMNGAFIPEKEAKVSIFDRGFQLGDSVFDVARTFGHKPFKLDGHIERLYRSLKAVRINLRIRPDEMKDITLKVLSSNLDLIGQNDDYWLIQVVTRGVTEGGPATTTSASDGEPTVIVYCQPVPFKRFAKYYSSGIHAIISSVRGIPPECVDARIKTYSRLNYVLADLEVKAQDPAAYALLLDTKGNLTEGTTNNLFLVSAGRLFTAKHNVLWGVTRQTVIDLAQELRIPTIEGDFTPYDLYTADEAFLSITSGVILPIAVVNGTRITETIPGPITAKLLKAFSDKVGVDVIKQAESHLD